MEPIKHEELHKEEHHEIHETFADSLGPAFFDGNTMRIEFCAIRMDEMEPSAKPTGKRHVVSRLVLSPAAAVALLDACTNLSGALNKIGVLKHPPAPSALKEYSPTREYFHAARAAVDAKVA
jgi:hypothetical protein